MCTNRRIAVLVVVCGGLALAACGGTKAGSSDGSGADVTLETIASGVDGASGNQLIIDQLEKTGANMDAPRKVIHYAYFIEREAADQAAAKLEAEGYDVEVDEGDSDTALMITTTEVVSLDTIDAGTAKLTELIAAGGGEYDGWEAAATP